MKLQHLDKHTNPSAAEIQYKTKTKTLETWQLRGGYLLGSSPAVQVHKGRVDEGDQGERCQTNINLKVEGRKECDNRNADLNKCSSLLFWSLYHVLTYRGSPSRTSCTKVRQRYCTKETTADRAITKPSTFPKWRRGNLHADTQRTGRSF